MRDRARIVLLAASGMGSRAIAREVGCTPGTASKWRVRYARDRMAGLSETGDRGAEPKIRPGAWAAHSGDAGSASARRIFQLDGAVAGAGTGRYP